MSLLYNYSLSKRLQYALLAVTAAVLMAGFWNYHLVDGFGKDVIAGTTIGNTSELSGSYADQGAGFGFVFAAIAGLAATFTACNCVVFAMIPGIACSANRSTKNDNPWRALGFFVAGVSVVCLIYGAYIGYLGLQGVELFTQDSVRIARAQTVFTILGVTMFVWGLLEMGFLRKFTQKIPSQLHATFSSASAKAGIIGLLVGLFSVGRPFPVFREFMIYAANAESPFYGALVMMVQGLGQILVMVILFVLLVWLAGQKMAQWTRENPHKPQLVSGLALLSGGTFFIFYWGLAFAFDIGRWGFKLGWY